MSPNNLRHFAELTQLIERFSNLNILVIGEAILDSYLQGASDRLCREAPVPIVDVSERIDSPGGGANTAVNIHSLGARVTFLSAIGDDREGQQLRSALEACDVSTGHLLVDPRRQTLAKHRVIGAEQLLVRYDTGATTPLEGALEKSMMQRLEQLYPQSDAVIISDYGYGIVTPRLLQTLARLQIQYPRLLVVDSKTLTSYGPQGYCIGPSVVKPNYGEAVRLLNLEPCSGSTSASTEFGTQTQPNARAQQITEHGSRILELTGAQVAAITLDKEGALVFERDRLPYRTYARPRPHSRAAGAGDTFVSAMTLALAAGAHTPAAAELASAAAAVVVGKDGTTACSAIELAACVAGDEKVIHDADELAGQLDYYRQQGRRIVFTNGCFDILHRGHITYLSQAKALGDVLIIGLNSDDSVRRLKGDSRPINPLEDRAKVLAALSCVDHIIPFAEDTPSRLLHRLRPDIMVKGGDYTRETLPEAPLVEALGGEVVILSYLDDFSTTGIIERIRAQGNGYHKQPLVVTGGD